MALKFKKLNKDLTKIKAATTIEPFPVDGRAVSEIVFNTSLSDDEINTILTEAKNIVGSIEGSMVGDSLGGTPIIAIGVNSIQDENALQNMMAEHFATSTEPFNLHLMIMIKRITAEDLQRVEATEEELEQFVDKPMIMSMALRVTADGKSGLAGDVLYCPNMTDLLFKKINGIPEEMSYEEYVAMAAEQGQFMNVTGPGWNKNIVNNNGIYKCFFPATMSWDNYKNGETLSGQPFVFDMPAANKVLEPLANLGGQKGVDYTLEGIYAPTTILIDNTNEINLYDFLDNKEIPTTITFNTQKVIEPYDYTIDENVNSIASYAYKDIKGLKNIIIHDSLTNIGDYAFHNCWNLESINIPESITTIGNNIFNKNITIKSFPNKNSFTSIGNNFSKYVNNYDIFDNIKEIETTSYMGDEALFNFRKLEKVTVSNIGGRINSVYPENGNGDHMFGRLFGKNTSNTDGIAITQIGRCQNYQMDYECVIPSTLTEIEIKNMHTIPEATFADLTMIKKITLPYHVSELGHCAFKNCTGLEELSLNQVTVFYDSSWYRYSNWYPEEAHSYKGNALYGCTNLKTISLTPQITQGGITSSAFIYDGAYYCNKTLMFYPAARENTTVTVKENNQIAIYAFDNARFIEEVILPEGVTKIERGTFRNCTSLQRINIPDSVKIVFKSAFNGCENLQYTEYNNAKYLGNSNNPYKVIVQVNDSTTFKLEDIHPNTEILIDEVFRKCSFDQKIVTIPSSIKTIGESCFPSDTESLIIPLSVENSIWNIGVDTCFFEASELPSGFNSDWSLEPNPYFAGQWEYDENNIPKPII